MTETVKKPGYIDLSELAISIGVLLYFIAVIVVNQVDSAVTSGFYYIAIILCFVFYAVYKREFSMSPVVFFALGGIFLATVNFAEVGNIKLLPCFILFSSFFLAMIFLSPKVNDNTFLIAVFLNAFVVAVKLGLHGLNTPVYVDSSNNYISIHLLSPALLYYTRLDLGKKKMPLYPVAVIWILCLLAGGRGGVLACTILAFGVVMRRYLSNPKDRRSRIKLLFILTVLMIPATLIILQYLVSRLSGLYVMDRFMNKGLDGGGRLDCWTEYIQNAFKSTKNFLFGVPLDEVSWAIRYKGNLHNSFLFVHAYTGFFGLAFLLGMLIRAAAYAIRNHMGVYLCCLITLCFRGMTDHMFGVNRHTVVVLAMVFIPICMALQKKQKGTEDAYISCYTGAGRLQGNPQ